MEGVEETRNENTDGLTQADSGQAAGYPPAALTTYTQGSTVTNGHGTEQVAIRGVQQVIENRPDVQNETHVGLGDDRGHLSISNVPGGVQVAVVPSTDDVRVVDGSLTSAASAVERTDDGTHTVVTAMPAEYGLPGTLQTQYVLHEEHEGRRNILCYFAFSYSSYYSSGRLLSEVQKAQVDFGTLFDRINYTELGELCSHK